MNKNTTINQRGSPRERHEKQQLTRCGRLAAAILLDNGMVVIVLLRLWPDGSAGRGEIVGSEGVTITSLREEWMRPRQRRGIDAGDIEPPDSSRRENVIYFTEGNNNNNNQ